MSFLILPKFIKMILESFNDPSLFEDFDKPEPHISSLTYNLKAIMQHMANH